MYTVYGSQGAGGIPIESFSTLDEALAKANSLHSEMSVAIKMPDGSFFDWFSLTEEQKQNNPKLGLNWLYKP